MSHVALNKGFGNQMRSVLFSQLIFLMALGLGVGATFSSSHLVASENPSEDPCERDLEAFGWDGVDFTEDLLSQDPHEDEKRMLSSIIESLRRAQRSTSDGLELAQLNRPGAKKLGRYYRIVTATAEMIDTARDLFEQQLALHPSFVEPFGEGRALWDLCRLSRLAAFKEMRDMPPFSQLQDEYPDLDLAQARVREVELALDQFEWEVSDEALGPIWSLNASLQELLSWSERKLREFDHPPLPKSHQIHLRALIQRVQQVWPDSLSVDPQLLDKTLVLNWSEDELFVLLVSLASNALESTGFDESKIPSIEFEYLTIDRPPTSELTLHSKRLVSPQLQSGTFLSLKISDQGKGIPSPSIPTLFEQTPRPLRARRAGKTLVQLWEGVNSARGEVQMHNLPQGGARIEIRLPLHPTPLVSSSSVTLDGPSLVGTIAVIDDDELTGQTTTEVLGRLGYASHWFPSRRAFLEAHRSQPGRFKLVLSDLETGMDEPMEALIGAKDPEGGQPFFVVVVSGKSFAHPLIDGYLPKPLSMAKLASTLEWAVQRIRKSHLFDPKPPAQ